MEYYGLLMGAGIGIIVVAVLILIVVGFLRLFIN